MKLLAYKIESLIVISLIIVAFFCMPRKSVVSEDTFVVGMTGGYAPWVSNNEQGQYEGFDIDIARALALKMNKKLVLKDLGCMSSLFIALNQKKIDAIIWAMSITKNRLQKVAMVRYQGKPITSYPLLFWKKVPVNIKSVNDMCGMTVCVEPASSQEAALNAYPFIAKKMTERIDDALLNLRFGKVNAALVEPAIAQKFMQKCLEIKVFNLPLTPEQQEFGNGICLCLDNNKLAQALERAVKALEEEGVIAALEKKWNLA